MTDAEDGAAARIRAEMAPERDGPPVVPQVRYILCSGPRVGSELVADGLAATGRAGHPVEYLNQRHINAWLARTGNGKADFADYWYFLLTRRSTANGVFGIKAHWNHLWNTVGPDGAARFLGQFDACVQLYRRDRIAQAVSLHRAMETDIWRLDDETAAPARAGYDAPGIARALHLALRHEHGWTAALAATDRPVLGVAYEDLVADYSATMHRIAAFLGLDDLAADAFAAPVVTRQTDPAKDTWYRRFLADAGLQPQD